MAEKRESGRVKDLQQKRVLDDAARRRRQRKALEALESDNFQDDPHADLKMSKKAPKFEESMEAVQQQGSGTKRQRKSRSDHFKFRYKKSFAALLEEDQRFEKEGPSYLSAQIPASRFPERHFCAVCGFTSNYTCVQCGARYCCVRCLGTHQDTRCLKWTA
ncbi:zinc finger HIT domain-containing protein 1-like [Mytilus californianus]|uniref:Zinc finger HIT domain-containing protein 1 n=2 Tax=Mytilus TaxID=6548 RepID=A0A8B6HDJ2_MYTGA|nr:zinc finger HIT domain-containing protein 1-like [Mytilus californianus]CAC5360771.1 ZNHIT1 [Mytilus coruscus]VDI77419.1 zinc finger HIT domain-containing protein 1 [Mytilus galloprovincialis]